MKRLILLLLFATGAYGQSLYRYENILLNQNGQPITGASVYVCTGQVTPNYLIMPPCPLANIFSDVGGTQPTNTNPLGNYAFTIAPGLYTVVFIGPSLKSSHIITIPSFVDTFVTSKINSIRIVDGVLFTTIQAAITDIGSNPGIVLVPPGYIGPYPATYPTGIVIEYLNTPGGSASVPTSTSLGFGGQKQIFSSGGTEFPTYANPDTLAPFKIWRRMYTNNTLRRYVDNACAIDASIIADDAHDAPHTLAGSAVFNDLWGCTMSIIRYDPVTTSSANGLSIIVSDGTGTSLVPKRGMTAYEGDYNNGSSSDPVAFDDAFANGGASDVINTGMLLTSVGAKKGGIGLNVKSNNPGNGNWQRGILVRDWSATGVEVINSNAGASGTNAYICEDLLGGQNCAMTWTVGVPTIAANIKWQCGQNATVDLSCYDATSAVNRLVFFHPSAGNSQTNLNSIGTSSIKFNVDTNSGSGGVEVWSGGVSPAKVAGINGSGALQIAGVTNGTGLQLLNTTTTCTTAGSVGATCTTAAITLPVAEADTSYRVVCTGKGLTKVPTVIATTNSSASQFTITIAALTAAAASFASYDCIVGHN